ncbi:Asp23/Gls24 family envelope stress response protein [soil metagenome]|jgi:uncharacterized alkaline shock family protein YloU|nr:Asp23/Gls24 family envelope stress response protein [Euzebyaceae bacterium]
MSDTEPTTARPSAKTGTSPATTSSGGGSASQLVSDRGTTSIADGVVAKIASLAAQEVRGVAKLGGAVSGALGSVVGRLRGSEHSTAGVGVEVGERQAAVDLAMSVEYPASIHQVAESVRESVIDRIESMTGLQVVEVNIAVTDLVFPGQEDEGKQDTGRVS